MTEDKKHKQKLIELPNECKKLNRYLEILPCMKIIYFR